MKLTFELNAEDARSLTEAARRGGVSVETLVNEYFREWFEERLDAAEAERASEEFRKNPVSVSFTDMKRELGIA